MKRCPHPNLTIKPDLSLMKVDHHRMGQGQPLSSAFAYFLGSKKGFKNTERISTGMPFPVS